MCKSSQLVFNSNPTRPFAYLWMFLNANIECLKIQGYQKQGIFNCNGVFIFTYNKVPVCFTVNGQIYMHRYVDLILIYNAHLDTSSYKTQNGIKTLVLEILSNVFESFCF